MAYYSIENTSSYYYFCRGLLAGLTGKDRIDAQLEYRCYKAPRSRLASMIRDGHEDRFDYYTPRFYRRHCIGRTKAPAGSSLQETLLESTVEAARKAIKLVDDSIRLYGKKAELISKALKVLPGPAERMRQLLSSANPETFDLLLKTARGEQVEIESEYLSEGALEGSFPYVFLSRANQTSTAFMPEEIRMAFSKLDLAEIEDRRARRDAIDRLLFGLTALCGIATMQEAYGCYLVQGGAGVDEQEFSTIVTETCDKTKLYRIVSADGIKCIANPIACRRRVFDDDYRWRREHNVNEFLPSLIAQHASISSPLAATDCGIIDPAERIYTLPSVIALTSYLDEHVPDGEDGCEFADDMVDSLIKSFMFEGERLRTVIGRLNRKGWFLAEGSNTAPLLTKLIYDLWRSLPRWELNGWSEQEWLDIQGIPELIAEDGIMDEELPIAS